MRKDKKHAIALRRAGKSYNEISSLLHIPKSTLSDWLKNDAQSKHIKTILSQPTSPAVKKRIKDFAEFNRTRWKNFREKARKEARLEFPALIKNPLFIAGIVMYWAEGDRRIENPVRLTNADPRMILLYIKFATEIIHIPFSQLRIGLIIYPDIDPLICQKYWSKITHIPQSQFYKTQIINGKHPTRKLSHGICMITLGSRRLKEKFLIWIDLLSNNL